MAGTVNMDSLVLGGLGFVRVKLTIVKDPTMMTIPEIFFRQNRRPVTFDV
jgi:hypothetical protein